ncbi:MAG: superfamily I DNA/RNA helicase, partial [Akkermansiaceae bacterium]
AKGWFDVVRKALKPKGQLFLAADPTQGFLKRRQSWLASGIDVRGRTTRLHRPYRNTRSILNFAARFFDSRRRENPEINPESFNLPTGEQLRKTPKTGSPPEIISCPTRQDIHLRAANEIAKLREGGLPAGQIFVLHADSGRLSAFESTLVTRLGNRDLVHNAKDGLLPTNAFCQTSTLNAVTGLEAPIVFLLGIDSILDRELDPQLSPEERNELHASQTSLLYMAFTRAGQKLIILSTSPDRVRTFENLS